MRHRLNEAYFMTMAKLFGFIALAIAAAVVAVAIWNGPPH